MKIPIQTDATAPTNTAYVFPKFTDGDVTIIISTGRVYQLHSHTLRQKSSYFKQYLRPESATKLTPAARRAGHTPWRFQLYQHPHIDGDIGTFIPILISESGRVQGNNFAPRASTNTLGRDDGDRHWDWLFGCFYGEKPSFDNSTFGATVSDCVSLVKTADTIDAIETVREAVDLALLQQDTVLWNSIASNPPVWAELGRRVQSPVIFKEAVVHIIGQWKMLDAEAKGALPKDIHQLCQTKWDELELAKRAIEIRIAGHYPAFLCQHSDDRPQRAVYANDIYMWMAICYFRQYVSQSGNDCRNRLAEDGGYAWYKTLATGGDSYLHHEDMKAFHQFFPMSSKACSVLEANMNVMKDEVKPFVKDLMINRTHIDPEKLEGVLKPWLTCAIVSQEDLPWYKSNVGERKETQFELPVLSTGDIDADDEAGYGME